MGHIELPVPVYNVTFMDQMLRILRARCYHCGHLKLHPPEINRFICKLRLLRHGLLREAQEIEDITNQKLQGPKTARMNGTAVEAVTDSEDEGEDDPGTLVERRLRFTEQAIKRAGGSGPKFELVGEKAEAVLEERRNVVKEFLGAITKGTKCGSCNG